MIPASPTDPRMFTDVYRLNTDGTRLIIEVWDVNTTTGGCSNWGTYGTCNCDDCCARAVTAQVDLGKDGYNCLICGSSDYTSCGCWAHGDNGDWIRLHMTKAGMLEHYYLREFRHRCWAVQRNAFERQRRVMGSLWLSKRGFQNHSLMVKVRRKRAYDAVANRGRRRN